MKKHFISALLALAGITATVQAQVVASYDDLILGFQATGGTGQNVNLEVDLGSITQFYNQPVGTKITLSRLAAADIASIYGNNWASRTDLVWGIVGTTGRTAGGPNGQPGDTLWATRAEATVGTQSTPWTTASALSQSNAAAVIEPLFLSEPGSLNGQTATSGSAYASAVNATLPASYSSEDNTYAGTSFSFFNPTINTPVTVTAGSYSVADLYELRPSSTSANATYLGSFGLKSDGTLTFASSPAPFVAGAGNETFTTQPASVTVVSGTTVVFTAAATGTPAPTYQWLFNGVAISGATNARLVIPNAVGANSGSYTVLASNSSGSPVSSTPATLTIGGTASNPGRLVNLSILSKITGSLSMGFVNGGSGTTGAENLLIRAVGPGVGPNSVFAQQNILPDPTLTVVQQSTHATVASNSGWGTPASNVAIIQAADTATGAFPLTDPTTLDSALVTSLSASTGGYSVVVSGKAGDSGTALTEVYDDTTAYTPASTRLVNLSCLTSVAANGSLSVGFVVVGSTAKTVLIRAWGPTLAAEPFSQAGTMPDPQLTISILGSSTVLAANSGWAGDTGIAAAAAAVGAYPFISSTSKDSATLLTVQPNNPYTVTVSSASGTAGAVLVEVYEVP